MYGLVIFLPTITVTPKFRRVGQIAPTNVVIHFMQHTAFTFKLPDAVVQSYGILDIYPCLL